MRGYCYGSSTTIACRRIFFERFALLILLLTSSMSLASDSFEYDIDIARLPLPQAMHRLANQSHTSIGIAGEIDATTIVVGPLRGRFSVPSALERLLAGHGLIAAADRPRSYEVRRAPAVHGPTLPESDSNVSDTQMIVSASRIGPASSASSRSGDAADALALFGVSSVGELMGYVPQVHLQPESMSGDGAQYADLRGLGPDLVGVTINRRWVAPSAPSGHSFDLNTIPLTAIERIEILDGADDGGMRAIGGVVNIVLKRGQRAPKARIEYGTTADGGAQRQVSLSAGTESSRLKSSLSVDYLERNELPGRASPLSRDQDFRRYGGRDFTVDTSWPGNIRSLYGGNLPGLSASHAAVPLGSTNVQPSIDDFAATAGQVTRDSLRRYTSISPQTQRLSVAGYAELSLRNISVFAELLGADRHTDHGFTPPTIANAPVPATNAYSPFPETVLVSRLMREIGRRRVVTDSRLLRFVTGVTGAFDAWGWELTAMDSDELAERWANNALNLARVNAALASSDPRTALNVFQSGEIGSQALLASLVDAPDRVEFVSRGTEVAGLLHGPLFELPAGELRAVVGAQWRKETTSSTRTVAICHADLRIPLLERLDAGISSRADRYSDVGPMFTPSYSLTWRPMDTLELRGTYGTNYRPPSVYELFGPSYAMQVPVADRRRDGEVSNVTAFIGSSAGLSPVSGKSLSMSARAAPSWLAGLKLGVNYWWTVVDSRIMAVPLSLALEHEDAFAGRIVRAPPTAEDIEAGRPGRLQIIDLSATNVGGIQARGFDADVSYRFPMFRGTIETSLWGTWMREFGTFDVPGERPIDRLGLANPRGTIPRWRLFGSVQWQHRLANASVIARSTSRYRDTLANEPIDRQLRAQTWFDLQVAVNLGALAADTAIFQGMKLTVGALNALDRKPQFAHAGGEWGFDPSLNDSRQQRFSYLRIDRQF